MTSATQALFERLYAKVDYDKGICPWEIVKIAVEQDCFPWYDPRFIKGYYDLLADCFLNTATWIKGQYYARLVISRMPRGIDDDLIEIAEALSQGELPKSETWNIGNPYVCHWPAPTPQYCRPWNGHMLLWSLAYREYRRLERREKFKATGYRSPRRNMYYS